MALYFRAPDRGNAADLLAMAAVARRRIEAFFGASFSSAVEVYVYPDRRSLTDRWRDGWAAPAFQPQCWMVAEGSAGGITILSPRVWSIEACEHDPSNAARTQALVTHELMHVYHAQHLPGRSFDRMDGIEWFAEGLATYVSGQLELGYLAPAREAIELGMAPANLRSAHSGKYRYGICGSMVRYIAGRVGRSTLLAMLALETTEALLEMMGSSEQQFLSSWVNSVRASRR